MYFNASFIIELSFGLYYYYYKKLFVQRLFIIFNIKLDIYNCLY